MNGLTNTFHVRQFNLPIALETQEILLQKVANQLAWSIAKYWKIKLKTRSHAFWIIKLSKSLILYSSPHFFLVEAPALYNINMGHWI